MISFFILAIILTLLTIPWFTNIAAGLNSDDQKLPGFLAIWHFLLAAAYYGYAVFNRSDSLYYFAKADKMLFGSDWFGYYGVSTKFIDFLTFPLVQYLGFSYEAGMLFFAWLGMIGFILFLVTISENIATRPKLFGYDLFTIILFMPNLHFWSSSIGKGSVIFFGFGLFFYGLSRLNQRWLFATMGAIIIYHVRPHILFIVLLASSLGYLFSSARISSWARAVVVLISLVGFYLIAEDVLALTGIDEESLMEDSTTLSHRARELSKATSGIDIASYSFPMKLFTFWFRPLFFDAPGALGIIVSFENVLYLLLFLKILQPSFLAYLVRSDALVKTALISFLGVSFALAQLSGNLGLAMRQKSQVMILFLFVILKYLDEKKQIEEAQAERKKKVLETQLERIRASREGRILRRSLN